MACFLKNILQPHLQFDMFFFSILKVTQRDGVRANSEFMGKTYSTTHKRSVEVQFGRYQKNNLQEWSMVKNLSCVSCAAWNVFPINSLGTHTAQRGWNSLENQSLEVFCQIQFKGLQKYLCRIIPLWDSYNWLTYNCRIKFCGYAGA